MAIQDYTPEPEKNPATVRNNELMRAIITQIKAENKAIKKAIEALSKTINELKGA